MKRKLLALALLLSTGSAFAQQDSTSIVPKPAAVHRGEGSMIINQNTAIFAPNAEAKKVAEMFNYFLEKKYGFALKVSSTVTRNDIALDIVSGDKYGDEVSIYYIGDTLESAYSKEFCGGPHIENLSELGHFRIVKEEAVSAGIRRIKAVLE